MRTVRNWRVAMDRRSFLVLSGAALAARAVPLAGRVGGRRVLTLVYDRSIGAMRAIDRLVP
ncbi:Tat pathway signal protein [Pseudaestuariivita atlantica]|uniref:Tat pathway signal protein n=2 Tax=Pseudaestuariivita atlantica TaxID=1317121 RepID=A0A0L1JLW3_9RHOB|nr:Tat pathway signal protein [Pseudaestuariivita atlantica]